jgi:hypothetical protein
MWHQPCGAIQINWNEILEMFKEGRQIITRSLRSKRIILIYLGSGYIRNYEIIYGVNLFPRALVTTVKNIRVP